MLILLFLTCISDSVELQIGSLPSRRIRELVSEDFFRRTSILRHTVDRSRLNKASAKIK